MDYALMSRNLRRVARALTSAAALGEAAAILADRMEGRSPGASHAQGMGPSGPPSSGPPAMLLA